MKLLFEQYIFKYVKIVLTGHKGNAFVKRTWVGEALKMVILFLDKRYNKTT